MNENKGLHLLYKKLGETPNQCILRFKKDNPEFEVVSMTYAGRLDPMAEGLLLVLSGGEINQKQKYLDLPKTYEVEVLWGFETDTLDLLGQVVESHKVHKVESDTKIKEVVENYLGKFEQKYPAYSSKPVNGKPLFQWARDGKINEVEIPSHSVEIYDAKYVGRRSVSTLELMENIKAKVALVSGDFRQQEILNLWNKNLLDVPRSPLGSDGKEVDGLVLDRISLKVSSGFYVRQFVADLAKKFETVATTFNIKRTRVGEYTVADSNK
jgi:tRNA pseudouridine(55) synthase